MLSDHEARAELEGGLDGVGEAAGGGGAALAAGLFGHQAVDHDLDGVALVLVEVDGLVEVVDLAVDAHADESGAAGVLEDAVVLALAVLNHGREQHEAVARRQLEDGVDDLLHRLALDEAAADGAVGPAGAGEEQAQVVVDLGDGADGGARVAAGALLVDGDSGAQAFDVIDVRLLHLAEELAGVGGEGLDVAALAFGVYSVERERRLARPGEARDDDELVTGDGDVDVFEVMFAGAADDDGV